MRAPDLATGTLGGTMRRECKETQRRQGTIGQHEGGMGQQEGALEQRQGHPGKGSAGTVGVGMWRL
jgi:hypothetical protein